MSATIASRRGTPFDQPRPKPVAVRRPREQSVAPDRSREQRMEALRNANKIRSRRAQLKRDMKAGRVLVVDILAAPPEYALTMKVIDVLMATPKVGWVKGNRVLKQSDSSPSKTLGGLSERQRAELVALLGGQQ